MFVNVSAESNHLGVEIFVQFLSFSTSVAVKTT